eukprot:g31381.t1
MSNILQEWVWRFLTSTVRGSWPFLQFGPPRHNMSSAMRYEHLLDEDELGAAPEFAEEEFMKFQDELDNVYNEEAKPPPSRLNHVLAALAFCLVMGIWSYFIYIAVTEPTGSSNTSSSDSSSADGRLADAGFWREKASQHGPGGLTAEQLVNQEPSLAAQLLLKQLKLPVVTTDPFNVYLQAWKGSEWRLGRRRCAFCF